MKNIKGYMNLRTELHLIDLELERITLKEQKLKHEKEELTILKEQYQSLYERVADELKNLKGVEQTLLYEIVVKGLNVTKAVDKVSFQYDLDVSTIWKSYYPRVKKFIQELEDV